MHKERHYNNKNSFVVFIMQYSILLVHYEVAEQQVNYEEYHEQILDAGREGVGECVGREVG